MKRRDFLRASSGLALPLMVNGFNLGVFARRQTAFNHFQPNNDRVLVLIQLDGGNDGLSTLIPIDQYDNLSRHRPDLLIPESSILKLNDHVGLHPSMTGMRGLYEEGKLTAVQGVAYPDQNRSHFRSTDIWQSASDADVFVPNGWMGRYYDKYYPGYPDDYPNEDNPDPFAVTVQFTVSDTCQGFSANYSMAVTDPFNVGQIDSATLDQLPNNNFGNEMAFLINAIAQTNAYSETVSNAANQGTNIIEYDPGNSLAQQLRTVALLISGGLKTQLYVVRIGGFDTHANQIVTEGNPTAGAHSNLLGQLSDAISSFQADLRGQGLEERVLGMTFSEFGRQIRENDSLGTDHGTAAPLFLFGSCVQGGIIGENPQIRSNVEPQEGVAMQHDFRTIYASVMKDWFELPDEDVTELLFKQFDTLPIIAGCTTTSTDDPAFWTGTAKVRVYPNPAKSIASLSFASTGGRAVVKLFDLQGRLMAIVADRDLNKGEQVVQISTGRLAPGTYIVSLQQGGIRETLKLVKQ